MTLDVTMSLVLWLEVQNIHSYPAVLYYHSCTVTD